MQLPPAQPSLAQPSPAQAPAGEGAEEAVAAFLRARPGFLRERPALYGALEPPRRVHGEAAADHMAAMLDAARERAAAAERALAAVAAARRCSEGFERRVREAVLTLMRAPDPAWLAAHELAGVLRVDAARLCSEEAAPLPGVAAVPRGTVATALGRARAVLSAAPRDPLLHGEAAGLAGQEALVRVPAARGPTLLALACRDGQGLLGASPDALEFLGGAVGAALDGARGGVASGVAEGWRA